LLFLDVDFHVEVLDSDSNTWSFELRVLHRQFFKFLSYNLVALLKNLNKHAGLLALRLSDKCVGNTVFVPCTTSPPDSMNVVFFVFRTIVVDNCFNPRLATLVAIRMLVSPYLNLLIMLDLSYCCLSPWMQAMPFDLYTIFRSSINCSTV
jgi:hypothetical protein